MALTASLYLLKIDDLNSLVADTGVQSRKNKGLLRWSRKNTDPFITKLDNIALEKTDYRWSGIAFSVLSVFSREKLKVDWDKLEYGSIANQLSKIRDAGVYIFSTKDESLSTLKMDGFYYSLTELDEFAEEFTGNKPHYADVMKNAIILLNDMLLKLTPERVVLLLIK
jgi:hypothetical protein